VTVRNACRTVEVRWSHRKVRFVVEAKALQLCGKFGGGAEQCAFLHSGWKKHDDALREGSISILVRIF